MPVQCRNWVKNNALKPAMHVSYLPSSVSYCEQKTTWRSAQMFTATGQSLFKATRLRGGPGCERGSETGPVACQQLSVKMECSKVSFCGLKCRLQVMGTFLDWLVSTSDAVILMGIHLFPIQIHLRTTPAISNEEI